ncbi:SDR family NAD(P)-dependent oxidoreductase [Dermatobacter hominis]|uniref:SDR family NAD(P)-dependent oxidoreductase n=1 Tax=Dermatobacter hominis TaxID=2884263 RepID=UPI001D1189FE|nr:SDR family NAD(P)-dependent oxidoreductase [Dermatobacter hominis]UDY35624.1 SDR family NAD(P)-dependent oxidoreductase [Dermatobacter hominis]
MEQFDGKVAVVTGGASGIGRAMAQAFVAKGMKVVLADIEAGPLEDTAQALRGDGGDVFAVTADVSRAGDVERIGEAAIDVFGALHVACNNAGVGGGGATWEVDLSTWEWVLGVNLMGVVHGLRSFTPRIIDSGGGHIVNTASMAGLTSPAFMSPYNVSKHAVVTMSESMYVELQMLHPEVGISVLCPGWVRTRIAESDRNQPDAVAAAQAAVDEATAAPGRVSGEQLKGMIDAFVAEGLQPAAVADMVVDAIEQRRFYILTHPEWQSMVRDRVDRMLSGEDPSMALPGN